MAAIPIVLNLESRGLSGFIIALYLVFDQIYNDDEDVKSALTLEKDAEKDGKMTPINRDGNQGEDTDADGEDRYVAAKFAEDQTCRKCHHIQSQSFLGLGPWRI